MILRFEKNTFKVLSTNARDVSDQYVLTIQGREYFFISLKMAVNRELFCTGHIYNPKENRFDCIDMSIQFLSLKEYGDEFLIGRELRYGEPISKGIKRKRGIDVFFAERGEIGIPSDAEFCVRL